MNELPGHLAWHGPLALLAPGLWLLCAALAVALIPDGRGRTVCAWLALLITAVVVACGWRAAWVLGIGSGASDQLIGGWQRDFLAGWVHGGLPWVVLAAVAASVPLLRQQWSWPARLAGAGCAHLAVVGLSWWLQVGLALALGVWIWLRPGARRIGGWLVVIIGSVGVLGAWIAIVGGRQ